MCFPESDAAIAGGREGMEHENHHRMHLTGICLLSVLWYADFAADPAIEALLGKYDRQAREDAEQVIGQLKGVQLSPDHEIAEIPTAQIEDTALIDLINQVQMYYTNAPVSAAALFTMDANMYPGDIRKCDMSLIYKYTETLCKLHMTGAQLKKYMEWSMNYFNTFHSGDLTISFNPKIPAYNYDMFEGVNYEVNIANAPGNRIESLTWPDGRPVADDDEFDIVVNSYRAVSHLLAPGEIYGEDDLPVLLEMDVRGNIGGVRDLIRDYIVHVRGGTIFPECSGNWQITGNDWDKEMHQKAVEMLASGKLTIPASENGKNWNTKPITEEDVQ